MTRALIVAVVLLATAEAMAQTPQTISYQAYAVRDGQPLRGTHHVVVRWYSSIAADDAVFDEWYDVPFSDGVVQLQLGEQRGLPLDLIRTGTVYLGITIDDDDELSPRTALTVVPYALNAMHAETAVALDREVTGVVTSVNEVAGNVRIMGDATTRVTKTGNVITISSLASKQPISGSVTPDGRSSTFLVRPNTTLTSSSRITATVVTPTGESIGCSVVSIDPSANTFTIRTAAVLLPSERLYWFLLQE